MLVFYNCIYSFNCLTGAMARWLGFQSCGAAAALLEFITIETLNLWLITFLTIHFRDINGNLFELILDFIDNHSFFIPYHTTHWSDWFANRKSEMRKTTSKKSLRSMKTSFDQSTLMYIFITVVAGGFFVVENWTSQVYLRMILDANNWIQLVVIPLISLKLLYFGTFERKAMNEGAWIICIIIIILQRFFVFAKNVRV